MVHGFRWPWEFGQERQEHHLLPTTTFRSQKGQKWPKGSQNPRTARKLWAQTKSAKIQSYPHGGSRLDTILRNIKPKLSQQIPFRTPFMEIAENVRVLGKFCMKTAEICCSKTCVDNFGCCYGNQGWPEAVENQFFFLASIYFTRMAR